MNWPENYKLIGDSLIADISLPGQSSGITMLERDARKKDILPDCYVGEVKEVGSRCKLVKVGDRIVFTRWIYSQSDVDDARICLREVDLVVVNERCVNGYIAVKLYNPFKKTDELIQMERYRERPKNYWGQIIDVDHLHNKNPETKGLKEGDIILFQALEDYQYHVGQHTMVFKNMYDVPILVLEPAKVALEVVA